MKLFIFEKPSVAKAVAVWLWKGKYTTKIESKNNLPCGYFQNGDDVITWAFGHIIRLAMPNEYEDKPDYKLWSNFKMFPEKFKLLPVAQAVAQLKIINDLLSKADVVINGGDPDREGQLLVDEIIEMAQYKGKVERILVNAIDDASIEQAYNSIEDNTKYKNLYFAGQARQRSDWLVGMNLSRVYTFYTKNRGYTETWNIGRVETPTLALLVNREKEIRNFKKQTYFNVIGFFKDSNGTEFKVTLIPSDAVADAEGRIIDKATANAIVTKLNGKDAVVKEFTKKTSSKQPPLPYSLDSLQVDANRKLGFSSKKTLDLTEELYLAKIVSYPRSDCNYLPTSQFAEVPRVLKGLKENGINHVMQVNLDIKSKCWDDSKITAHHAIIPTGVALPEKATQDQKDLYKLIAERYLMQFFPAAEFNTFTVTLQVDNETLKGSGKEIVKFGFMEVAGFDDIKNDEDEVSKMPALTNGENIGVAQSYKVDEKETTPPKRFTDGSLIAAMTNIYKYLPADSPYRDKLKEIKGIGTPATRSDIIAKLQSKGTPSRPRTPFVTLVKKFLVPTELGITLIENVSDTLISPESTAIMEIGLAEIVEGKNTIDNYLKTVEQMITDNIGYAENHEFPIASLGDAYPCPKCEEPLLRKYSKKIDKYFWVCSDENCKDENGKTVYYEDYNGKPLIEHCTKCKGILKHLKKKDKDEYFFICEKCQIFYDDVKGKAVEQQPKGGKK